MRHRLLLAIFLILVVLAVGCTPSTVPTDNPADPTAASTPMLGVAAAPATPAATTISASNQPATSTPAPTPSPTPTTASTENATAAIKTVIERANVAQQRALASGDPSVMRENTVGQYYDELSQTNVALARDGVTEIELVKIEWGEIGVSGNSAQANAYETWQSTYDDGTLYQSRDLNVYTLVLQNGVWKIQSDEHPKGTGQQPGSSNTSPAQPSPSTTPVTPATGGDTSRNWSGYMATGGTFTSVRGTWTIPESSLTGDSGSSASWVGIGGVESSDLIQAGTMQSNSGSGAASYSAWIEMLPAPPDSVPLVVRPGDSVTVEIGLIQTGQWRISMKNESTGKVYETTVRYTSSLSSAEWVHEAPSVGREVVSLDDFGTVQFSGATATKDGKTVTIAAADGQPVTLADARGNALAVPSALGPDGQSFTVGQTDVVPTAPALPSRRLNPVAPVPTKVPALP